MIDKNSGYSLIEVIIAAGMLGITAIILGANASNTMSSMEKHEKKVNRIRLMNYINNNFDCSATFAASPTCDNTTPVTLYDRFGNTIPNSFGAYEIKGTCNDQGLLFQFRASASSTFKNLLGNLRYCYTVSQAPIIVTETQPMEETIEDCESMLRGSAMSGPFLIYKATLTCPDNYTAITGGATCGHNGTMISSRFLDPTNPNTGTRDRQSWFVECCASQPEAEPKMAYANCQLNVH